MVLTATCKVKTNILIVTSFYETAELIFALYFYGAYYLHVHILLVCLFR